MKWFCEEHAARRFLATIYIISDIRCTGYPRENPFRFPVTPNDHRSASPNLVAGSRMLSIWRMVPIDRSHLRHGAFLNPPRLREKKRILVKKKEKKNASECSRMREGWERTKRKVELSGRRIARRQWRKSGTRHVVPEINRRPRCHNLARVARKKLVQYGATGSLLPIVQRRF